MSRWLILLPTLPHGDVELKIIQYQELFAVCQAFSGPGSTKMYYCLNLIHDGFLSAVVALLIWRYALRLLQYGRSC
jgi:hypothetical protein